MEIAEVNTPGEDQPFQVGKRRNADTLDELPATHLPLLTGPVTATLATTGKDGRVQLSPVWVDHDGAQLNLNSVRDRVKDRNMRARPDVALLFVNPNNPYHWMSINGRVVEVVDEDDGTRGQEVTDNIDGLAENYIGQRPYPFRDPAGEVRVMYKVLPDKILTFGAPE